MGNGTRKIVLASRNPDKLRELGALCQGLPFTVVSSLDYPGLPEVIEDGTSALGNASRKAILTAAFTGEIAVADDTALPREPMISIRRSLPGHDDEDASITPSPP